VDAPLKVYWSVAAKRRSANHCLLEGVNTASKQRRAAGLLTLPRTTVSVASWQAMALTLYRNRSRCIGPGASCSLTTAETREMMDKVPGFCWKCFAPVPVILPLWLRAQVRPWGGAVAAMHYSRVLEILKTTIMRRPGATLESHNTGDLELQSPRPAIQLFARFCRTYPTILPVGWRPMYHKNNWQGALWDQPRAKTISTDYLVCTPGWRILSYSVTGAS